MKNKHSNLFVIAGPTAVGKTALSINLAKQLNCSILSADSRQFYKEISIGTAKPTNEELKMVKHHFINNKSINQLYSAGEYEKDVLKHLEKHFKNTSNALLVGGSGMYINAVCNGLDELPRNLEIRTRLNEEFLKFGIKKLQNQLKILDPVHYQEIDHKNPQRLIRAIEVSKITNKPYSELLTKKPKPRPFKSIKILLHTEKEILNKRIEKRVNEMVENGLFEEVENLIDYQNHNALKTVGYSEIFDFFNGITNKDEAITKIKNNTKKYAKRQMTWFKKDKNYLWVNNKNEKEALLKTEQIIREKSK